MKVDSIPMEGISLIDTADREEPVRKRPVMDGYAVYLGDPKLWENYENVELAEAESMLRDWIGRMGELDPAWKRSAKRRRYTFAMLFKLVTGEDYEQKRHSKVVYMWTQLFRYYSSRLQKAANIGGKLHVKTIYVISPKRLEKPPYSLRLRLPWLQEHGVTIDQRTLYNPQKDDLKPGHARNPRTDATMEKRRQEGLERYRKRYADRSH